MDLKTTRNLQGRGGTANLIGVPERDKAASKWCIVLTQKRASCYQKGRMLSRDG